MAGVPRQFIRVQSTDVDPTFDIDGPVQLRQIIITGASGGSASARIRARSSPDSPERDTVARLRAPQSESIPIPMYCVTLYDLQIDSLDSGQIVLHFA